MTVRFFVCALALLGVSLVSGAQRQPAADTVRDRGVSPLRFKVASSVLYALPDEVLDGREHQLEFVVTEGLTETLRESAAFQVEKSAARPVVEVLALHPQFLASLLEDRGRDRAYIAIHLDGNLVEELALSELSKRSLELAGQELTMVGVQAPARSSALSAAINPVACVQGCEDAWRVRERFCERFPRPNCEEQNDSRLTLCLQTCGCPVAIREVRVVTTFVGDSLPPQLVCLIDSPRPVDGHYYDRRSKLFRKEHYNEVVSCDGIHNIELGNVEYMIERCDERRQDFPLPCLPLPPGGGIPTPCR